MKIILQDLVVEVTKKCNMNCAHCLRGPARNEVLTEDKLPFIFKNVSHVSMLTLTGGEPSLCPEVIEMILNYMKNHNISLGAFYMVTNAYEYNEDFVFALLKLYAYADEKELCGLSVSRDQYHFAWDDLAYQMYTAFKFYNSSKEYDYLPDNKILKSGNAYENGLGEKSNDIDTSVDDISVDIWSDVISVESSIYVSSEGYITLNCDMSYEEIECEDFHIGQIGSQNKKSLYDIIMTHEELLGFEDEENEVA